VRLFKIPIFQIPNAKSPLLFEISLLFEICNLEALLNQFAIGHYENISSKNHLLFEICNLEALLNQFAIGHYENIAPKNLSSHG
jgi:hypothetical protein